MGIYLIERVAGRKGQGTAAPERDIRAVNVLSSASSVKGKVGGPSRGLVSSSRGTPASGRGHCPLKAAGHAPRCSQQQTPEAGKSARETHGLGPARRRLLARSMRDAWPGGHEQ